MGVALLDPLTSPLPRLDLVASSFPRARMVAPASAAADRREAATLPAFSGLRVSARPRRTVAETRALVIAKADSRRGLVTCEAQDTAVEVPDVAKETWQSLVMECPRPVVVEFWAPWCGPCRMIHPVMAKVAKEYEGKMDCFKINTDDCPDLAAQYGIRSIPTIMIFKNGEKKDTVIGAVPESTLVSCIQRFLER